MGSLNQVVDQGHWELPSSEEALGTVPGVTHGAVQWGAWRSKGHSHDTSTELQPQTEVEAAAHCTSCTPWERKFYLFSRCLQTDPLCWSSAFSARNVLMHFPHHHKPWCLQPAPCFQRLVSGNRDAQFKISNSFVQVISGMKTKYISPKMNWWYMMKCWYWSRPWANNSTIWMAKYFQ